MYPFPSATPQRSAFARHAAGGFSGSHAYRSVAVETGVASADPHRLIAMLYDGFSESIAQARGAIRSGDLEAKGRAIGRAVRIVDEGLRASLDLTAGGAVAQQLHVLYGYVLGRLTHANLHHDDAALAECLSLIEPVASAWAAIAPGQRAA